MLALLAADAVTAAENYPYRSDYLWVTVPDHDDWTSGDTERAHMEWIKRNLK